MGVLTEYHRVTYRKVGLRESDGKIIPVSSGLEAGEKVILNPGLSLEEGAEVQPLELEQNKRIIKYILDALNDAVLVRDLPEEFLFRSVFLPQLTA